MARLSSYHAALQDFRRDFWRRALIRVGGSVRRAAKEAGVNRTYLHKALRQLKVPRADRAQYRAR